MPFCQVTLTAKKPPEKAFPKELLTIGDHLRKRRLDLKLLQKDVAGILNVDTTTVTNWEKGRCSPTLQLMPRVVQFLGYEATLHEPETLGDALKRYRCVKGISQKELARQLGIDPSTLAKYEADKHKRRSSIGCVLSRMVGVTPNR